MVFRKSFDKQAISFGKIRFFWLAFFLAKSGFQDWLQGFSKSFGKFGLGFLARFIFSGKVNFSQSQSFSVGFRKFSALAFGMSVSFSKTKSGL